MDLGRADDLATPWHVCHEPDEVAHGAAGDQQAGLCAEQVSRALLECPDCRVLAEDVIADLGLRHRPTHRG